jgi:exosortase/archaeosortase family protein
MKKGDYKRNYLSNLIARYSILVLFGILNNWFFYLIFTPLTIYPVYFLLSFLFPTTLMYNVLFVKNIPIEIIGSCIAGSAYYLLLILNLATPTLKWGKRIGMLLFSFASLLTINILRIFLLSVLYVSGVSFFDTAHKLFWYFGSVLFVVLIWFLSVRLFHVKEIPFYSDVISLLHLKRKNEKPKVKSKRKNYTAHRTKHKRRKY